VEKVQNWKSGTSKCDVQRASSRHFSLTFPLLPAFQFSTL
jgi:hypothetical protein